MFHTMTALIFPLEKFKVHFPYDICMTVLCLQIEARALLCAIQSPSWSHSSLEPLLSLLCQRLSHHELVEMLATHHALAHVLTSS